MKALIERHQVAPMVFPDVEALAQIISSGEHIGAPLVGRLKYTQNAPLFANAVERFVVHFEAEIDVAIFKK